MSLFHDPDEHAANPPETWQVRKIAERCWSLSTSDGVTLESFTTKRAAEAARSDSFTARLYAREARWYAGETVHPLRPWADVLAERERRAARRQAVVLGDGCVDGHSPDLVSCSLGVDWP